MASTSCRRPQGRIARDPAPYGSDRAGSTALTRRALLALLVTPTLAALPVAAAERLVGRAHAIDGDTVAVAGVHVRLQGVAAPEIAHPELGIEEEPGGPEAAAFMARLVNGRTLACEPTGERSRGRPVGVCRLDGRDVGAAVIAAGLARECPRFSRGRYAKIETEAGRRLPLPGYCTPR